MEKARRDCLAFSEMRQHERKLNTINENPQISPMTQIFSLRLCAFAPLRLCVKLFSMEKRCIGSE